MKIYGIYLFHIILFLGIESFAQENSLAVSIGNFDVLQSSHQTTEARIEYRFSKIKYGVIPFAGLMVNFDGAYFISAGLQYDIKILDTFVITPSFSPGIYEKGKSKNLDFLLEFRTQIEFSLIIENSGRIGINFNHISNGRLSLYNPGTESLAVTYIYPL